MLTFFHRFLPAYYLLLCALLGLSLAWLVTSETGIRLSSQTITAANPATQNAKGTNHRPPQDNRIILQRNIFDSSRPAQAATVAAATPSSQPGQRTQVSSSAMSLVGTVVADEESLAVIDISGQIEVIRIDHLVPGNGTLVTVTRDFIEIEQNDGTMLVLTLEQGSTVDNTPTKSVRPGTSSNVPTGQGIQALGGNRWLISGEEAESARNNIGVLIKQVRVDPYIVDGKTSGFVIKRIQRGTLLYQMGLKRGDVLFAINGTTLDSPEKGLQVFQQLREAKNLSVDLQRAGQPLNFQYEIK